MTNNVSFKNLDNLCMRTKSYGSPMRSCRCTMFRTCYLATLWWHSFHGPISIDIIHFCYSNPTITIEVFLLFQ